MFCQFHFFVVPLRPKYKFEYKYDKKRPNFDNGRA